MQQYDTRCLPNDNEQVVRLSLYEFIERHDRDALYDEGTPPAVTEVNAILRTAIAAKASEFHIGFSEDALRFFTKDDNTTTELYRLPATMHKQIIERFVTMAKHKYGLPSVIPQDGSFTGSRNGDSCFAITSQGVNYDVFVTWDRNDESTMIVRLMQSAPAESPPAPNNGGF